MLILELLGAHVAAFVLTPRSVGRTDIECLFLFAQDEIASPTFDPSDTVDFWDLVNRQDWSVCERVQRGMANRVHKIGYYAPMEDFNLDIRRYVVDRIGDHI